MTIFKKNYEGDEKNKEKKYLLSLEMNLFFFWKVFFISRNWLFFSEIGNNLMRALGRK